MIVRSKRKDSYTIVNNTILEEARLSFRSKGVLVYLLSKPDYWSVSERHLATVGDEGVTAIRSALKELESAGYILRKRSTGEDGRFKWESIVYDEPQAICNESEPEPQPAPESQGQPCSENLSMVDPPDDSPCLGFPCVDKPCVDNHTLVSTVLVNTDQVITKEQTTTTTTLLSFPGQEPDGEQAQDQDDAPVAEPDSAPPVAPPPPEVSAVAAALLDQDICANEAQARIAAAALLARHPPDWVIRAAVETGERRDVKNPHAYMLGILGKWDKQGDPRPAGSSRKRGGAEPETEADRRRKYVPDDSW